MPAQDPYGSFANAPDGPYNDGFLVTPSDTVDFSFVASKLFVLTAQTALTIVTLRGTVLALGAVAAGTVLPIRVRRVNATGTAPGTGIFGLL